MPDAVGEGQAERSADDEPQDGAAEVAPAEAGAAGPVRPRAIRTAAKVTGTRAGPGAAGWRAEAARAEGERQRRCGGGLDGAGDVSGSMSVRRRDGRRGRRLVSSVGDAPGGGRGQALRPYSAVSSASSSSGLRQVRVLLGHQCALAVALAGDQHILTQRHRHRPGDQSRQPGGEERPRGQVAPATPMTMPATDTIPSSASSTAARSQFSRPAVPPVCGLRARRPPAGGRLDLSGGGRPVIGAHVLH